MTHEERLLAIGITAANSILVGTGVLGVLALAYFVYYYGWTSERQFTSWMGVLLCYVSPALLAILLFASLRLRQSRRINLALVVFSVGVSLFALEILLLPAYRKFGLHFDTRTRIQVMMDVWNRGVAVVPSIFAPALLEKQEDGTVRSVVGINGAEVLPLAGIAHKVTLMCNESGEWIVYRSDAHGFHNPEYIWKYRDISIAAVGDSFTHGVCVPSDKNFGLMRSQCALTCYRCTSV